jgi:putative NADPH-quinone reductase
MRIQVVHCHPLVESYDHSLYLAILEALRNGGHEVIPTDLYREGFDPAMTEQERRSYMSNHYRPDGIEAHIQTLSTIEGIVFCFPHWWLSMPAVLKGYFDRVWAPGTAFRYDEEGVLQPNLQNIRLIAVVTSFGSPWWFVRLLAGNPGRKVFRYAVQPLCAKGARMTWLALYGMDKATDSKRAAFLEKVRSVFGRIR